MKLLIFLVAILSASVLSAKIVNHKLDSILLQAVENGNLEGVRELLASHIVPDIEVNDSRGWTALIHATGNNHADMLKLLIDNGADVNAKDKDGRTALLTAATWNYINIAKMLIDNGANINAKDKDGKTALMLAAIINNKDMVKMLIDRGADINAKSNTDWTARDCYRNKDEFDNIVAEYIAKIRSIIQEQDQLIPDLGNIITEYI
jgi:ankyrin repeat protein